MDKKELIGYILNDIKELELIAKGMHEMEKIPGVMQQLAVNKTQNILDRFLRLGADAPVRGAESVQIEEKKAKIVQIEQQPEEKIPEEMPETVEPLQEEPVELIVEEQEIVPYQEIEPEENTVSEPEKAEPVEIKEKAAEVVEEQIQPETKHPEKEKSTIPADVKTKVQEHTTNEKFKSRVPAANAASTTGKRIESRFIQNLRKAINLNDRYRYQRELFGGNSELMNSVIDKLDTMSSLDEAVKYVQTEFIWDAESPTVTDFYSLLESRFS